MTIEKLKIRESYKEVKSFYTVNVTNEKVSTLADVLFVGEDGISYLVACRWDGEASGVRVTTKADYEESFQSGVQSYIGYYRVREGREAEIEIVES